MKSLAASLLLLSATHAAHAADLPAFPGAEGFGALATGGRGGEIVRVTNLNDAGPGSLRDAVSKPNRFVVFTVSGIIKLESNLAVPENTTLAGETAFANGGEGICIYNRSVSFSEKSNIIVRHLRFRQGIDGDRGKCSINISNGSNMIFDHCSIQWGRWDSLGCTQRSRDITFQNCIIGEAIDPQRFGALIDSVENITVARTLWINNQSRNPKAKGTIQYINNVIYNYGGTGLAGGHSAADHSLDVINNYIIAGPSSTGSPISGFSSSDHVFSDGNLLDLDKDGALNGRPITRAHYNEPTDGVASGSTGGVVIPPGQKPYPTFLDKPWSDGKPPVPVTVLSAPDAFKKVLDSAGASLRRDATDARLIQETASLGREGKVIRSNAEVGTVPIVKPGQPLQDSDADGIPDAWESANRLNPHDPADAARRDPSGYLVIERYAHSLTAQ